MSNNKRKKSSRKHNSKSKSINNKKPKFMLEIVAVLSLALSLILLLSLMGIGANFGKALKSFQLGLFGILGYIFPIVFVLSYLFFAANLKNNIVKIKIFIADIIYLLSVAFINLFSPFIIENTESLINIYKSASYGGLIGALISGYLSLVIGKILSGIFIIVLIFIAVLFISGISFFEFVNAISSVFYETTKENLNTYKQKIREKKESAQDYDYEEIEYIDDENLDIVEHRKTWNQRAFVNPLANIKEDSIFVEENKILREKESLQEKRVSKIKDKEVLSEKKDDSFSVPENKFLSNADVFTGVIVNSDANVGTDLVDNSLDLDIIERANSILKKKEQEKSIFNNISIESDDEDISLYHFEDSSIETETDINIDTYLDTNTQMSENLDLEENKVQDEEDDLEEIEKISDLEITKKQNYINDTASLVSGERKVYTSSGRVIETEADKLEKKIELAKAQKYESALVKPNKIKKEYIFPSLDLLKKSEKKVSISDDEYKQTAIKLQQTLSNFGVAVRVANISKGPVVTRYELIPDQGVKVSKIVSLQDDIKLSLAAADIRIEAPIPGKSAVGIEVPNKENNIVSFRELLESRDFRDNKDKISFALGKDISGQVMITDISKMPHLLIAGATGSGKSVCINTLIMSILYGYKPDDVKLMMIDPKVVELSVYNGIPHLLIPVVTEPKKAASAINWAVAEMTDRYNKFAILGARNIKDYNEKIEKEKRLGNIDESIDKLPRIVIIIDELADLMMVAQNEVEEAIARLAQLARACGIHLVIATQRPSVNVITGLIKANIPSRIAFAVSSGIDSRTILDTVGAEKLLGKGDMLFSSQGMAKPMRVQGALVTDNEVYAVVDFIKNQGIETKYDINTIEKIENTLNEALKADNMEKDELFMQAGRFIIDRQKASIGNLQRVFKIGFNRAARIMDQLCESGVVGAEAGTKPREILMDIQTFENTFS